MRVPCNFSNSNNIKLNDDMLCWTEIPYYCIQDKLALDHACLVTVCKLRHAYYATSCMKHACTCNIFFLGWAGADVIASSVRWDPSTSFQSTSSVLSQISCLSLMHVLCLPLCLMNLAHQLHQICNPYSIISESFP